VGRLLTAGARVEHRDTRGFTVLMIAAWTGRVEPARLLLDHGAGVDSRDTGKGRTALMWAALKGHPAFVKMLLEQGADPAMQDNAGQTAELLATKYHHPAVVKTLKDAVANRPGPGAANR